jgi:uridylate kinase
LAQGKIVIASSGSGNPFFTTDSAGALRAAELECEAIIKLTKVDGVYDNDPIIHIEAKKYENLSYHQVLEKDLKIIDATAIILARDNNIPIFVTKLDDTASLKAIIS